MSAYQAYGLILDITVGQLRNILTAGKQDKFVTIRILKKNLHGDHKLFLTKIINKLNKFTSGGDLTLLRLQVKQILNICIK